jgi:hypothetical protein
MADISKFKLPNGSEYDLKDSTARSGLSGKQDTLVSGTNIKTVNSTSLLGSGNINTPSLTHTNEFNIYGGAQNGNFWFNYRNAETDAQESTAKNTVYNFGNYKGGTAGTTIKAGKLNINDSEMTDFVIANGTSGSWYYRKWKSGKVEAWASISWTSQTPTQWVTNLYYKDLNTTIPSGIFSAVPSHVTATTTGSDNNLQWAVYSTQIYNTSGTYSITVRFTRPNSTAGKIKATIHLWS